MERRQFVMALLQRPNLGLDAEQLTGEILEMGREIDQQVRFVEALDRVRVAPRRHQSVVQTDINRSEMRDECTIEADQTLAGVKIGAGEPVLEDEIGHRKVRRPAAADSRVPRVLIRS